MVTNINEIECDEKDMLVVDAELFSNILKLAYYHNTQGDCTVQCQTVRKDIYNIRYLRWMVLRRYVLHFIQTRTLYE